MTQPRQAKPVRKRVLTLVRVLVSFGLLAFVLFEMGFEQTLRALGGAHLGWVLVVLALMLLEGLHGTYKWLILLRHTHANVGYWPLFKLMYVSGFLGMFVPGGVGIELVRMYGLARQTSDLAMSFTSILMDRILGLTGLSLVILAGVLMHGRSTIPGIEYWTGGALLLILAGWVAIMNTVFRRFTDRMLAGLLVVVGKTKCRMETTEAWVDSASDRKERRVKRAVLRLARSVLRLIQTALDMMRGKQAKVYASLDTYRRRPGLLAWAMVQSIVYNGIRIAVCYATGLAVGVDAPIAAYVIAVPVVIFVMIIPVSMAGWGVREAAFVQLLTPFGADGHAVTAMSILVGILGTVSILPGAWFCIRGMRETPVKTAQVS